MIRYLVSIHDVMPETLANVDRIVAAMKANGWPPATLLVVPGRHWGVDDLAQLRTYSERGHTLAGHGWMHRVHRIRNLRHRAHSLLISRRVAEHYALDELGVEVLARRCRAWFSEQGLPEPELYVPPAWALGPATPAGIARAGYRFVETLNGVYDAKEKRFISLPVLGYEADTAFRALFLRLSNTVSLCRGRRAAAVRLAIHPQDYNLKLSDDLRALIRRAPPTVDLRCLPADLAA